MVPPCEEVDILTRTNDKPSIDSSNPADTPNLSSGDNLTWVSNPPAAIIVTFKGWERVMRVEVENVTGPDAVTAALLKNGTVVDQVDVPTNENVSISNAFYCHSLRHKNICDMTL